MKTHAQVCIAMCLCTAGFSAASQTNELFTGETNRPGVKIRSGFSGTLSLKGREGEVLVPVRGYGFSIWHPRPLGHVKPLSEGLVLIQAQTGETESIVGGTTNRSKPGDFLFLNRDSNAAFRAASETATFEALVLGGAVAETKLRTLHAEFSRRRSEKYEQISGGPLKIETLSTRVGNFSVEVQDLLVGPSQRTGLFALPGAALLEVRSGKGVLRVGAQEKTIRGGSVVTVKEAEQLELRNDAENLGLSIHATIVRSQ